ncbi:MAG: Octanoyltransferase LipM [Planctomycetota bacterium]
MEARLIIDAPAPGAWNMAVDEVLLGSASERSALTLRFYRWAEPVVTLGYFQAYAGGDRHEPSRACLRIRRSTGGGAIVHDRELTYSLAVPTRDRWASPPQEWYELLHRTLVDVLADFGIVAKQHAAELEETDDAFLCFQRRSTGDVVIGSYKVCGSAQRRHHQSMLQHGSVLLARSEHAPELPGLEDLQGAEIAVDELREAWLAELVKRLGFALVPGELTESERQAAERVMFERYAADSWNRKR